MFYDETGHNDLVHNDQFVAHQMLATLCGSMYLSVSVFAGLPVSLSR